MQQVLSSNELRAVLPFFVIAFGATAVVLPAITYSFCRKAMQHSEPLAVTAIVCGSILCFLAIALGAAVVLAMIGWLPNPTQW